jgi:integrase
MTSPHKTAHRIGEAAGVADFRLHDLRRTGASRMEALGVESDTIEAALGHSRPSLARTYRPAFPEAKVRAALTLLASHYRATLGPAWWEPDEAERERVAQAVRMCEQVIDAE